MNILLFFFAIPIAIIILSVILETYMRCPLKVAGIFFSIFLVLAFYLGGTAEYIVAALVYTGLSFISAYLTALILSRKCFRQETCPHFYREDTRRMPESEFELPTTSELTSFNTDFDAGNNCNNCYRRYR